MITQKEIADELSRISKVDVFRITRRRENVEVRSLLNHVLYNYKKMPLSKITKFYNNNGWNINHATIIHSLRTFDLHKKYNPSLLIWLEHIVDNINKMDNFIKREYIRAKINSLDNKDIDELTMVISNMPERELDLKAIDIQRRADQDMNSNEIRENEIDERLDIEKMKLENNEDQAAERIRIADEKLEIARKKKK